jgi:hypothetical protein
MPDPQDMTDKEVAQAANTHEAELTRRLIVVTRWLIGWTIALVVVGTATLVVALVVAIRG